MIARTGYSGEDGFELYLPADEATTVKVWNELLAAGEEFGIRPCGLGARNTLRLEAGMSLYGHEISDSINVFEAGLDRWLKLDKGNSSAAKLCWTFRPPAAPRANSSRSKWSTAASHATGTPYFRPLRKRDRSRSRPVRRRHSSRPTLLSRWFPQRSRNPAKTSSCRSVPLRPRAPSRSRCLSINGRKHNRQSSLARILLRRIESNLHIRFGPGGLPRMTLSIFEVNRLKHAPHVDGVLPVFLERRSPRAFDNRDVSPADLARVFEAARWAASSGNGQPWRFLVGTRNSPTHRQIFESLVEFNKEWAGNAPVLILGAAMAVSPRSGKDKRLRTLRPRRCRLLPHAPGGIAGPGSAPDGWV